MRRRWNGDAIFCVDDTMMAKIIRVANVGDDMDADAHAEVNAIVDADALLIAAARD